MIVVLRVLCLLIAALGILDAGLVVASLLMADTAPMQARFALISLVFAGGCVAIALISAGIGRQAGRLAEGLEGLDGVSADAARVALRRLAGRSSLAGLLTAAAPALVAAAILARIGEGRPPLG
jgi:hypothetical protein